MADNDSKKVRKIVATKLVHYYGPNGAWGVTHELGLQAASWFLQLVEADNVTLEEVSALFNFLDDHLQNERGSGWYDMYYQVDYWKGQLEGLYPPDGE